MAFILQETYKMECVACESHIVFNHRDVQYQAHESKWTLCCPACGYKNTVHTTVDKADMIKALRDNFEKYVE